MQHETSPQHFVLKYFKRAEKTEFHPCIHSIDSINIMNILLYLLCQMFLHFPSINPSHFWVHFKVICRQTLPPKYSTSEYICVYIYVLLQLFEKTCTSKAQILSIPFDTIWWILRNPYICVTQKPIKTEDISIAPKISLIRFLQLILAPAQGRLLFQMSFVCFRISHKWNHTRVHGCVRCLTLRIMFLRFSWVFVCLFIFIAKQ